MATVLNSKMISSIGLGAVDVVTTNTTTRLAVIGLSLTNIINEDVTASVSILDSTSTEIYYVKDVSLPKNQSLRTTSGEKLVIPPSSVLRIRSNTPNSIDAIVSYAEIT